MTPGALGRRRHAGPGGSAHARGEAVAAKRHSRCFFGAYGDELPSVSETAELSGGPVEEATPLAGRAALHIEYRN